MFTVTSHPFAEMTQGLSGMQRSSSSSLELNSPMVQPAYSHYHQLPKEKSSNWWKIVLGVVALLSAIGIWFWVSEKDKEKAKNEAEKKEQKRLEEERLKALE